MRLSRRRSLSLLPALMAPLAGGGASAQPTGSTSPLSLKLVVLDIGGTLIGDHGEVPDAMLGAFARKGITVTPQEFSGWRGASKRGMVKHFVEERGPATGRAALEEAIYADFTTTVSKAYQNVQPIPGAENVLALRCIHSSRRLDPFWKHRLNQHAKRNDTLALAA